MRFLNSKYLTSGVYLLLGVFTVGQIATAPFVRLALAKPETHSIFERFPGRWVGKGRLVFRDGQVEEVKCRVTYFVSDNAQQMRQNIRCATAGGKIEVKSKVRQSGGRIYGTWRETIYDLNGELTGHPIENGLILFVRSGNVRAAMQLMIYDNKQIAEIQFNNQSLVGLTLLLRRG